jgi:hypothetical protein
MGELREELEKVWSESEYCNHDVVKQGPRTGQFKLRHKTKEMGESFAASHEAQNGPQKTYYCKYCGGWHNATPAAAQFAVPSIAAGGSRLAPVVIEKETIAIAPTKVDVAKPKKRWVFPPSPSSKAGIAIATLRDACGSMTVREVANKHGVTIAFVYSLCHEFDLPYKPGRKGRTKVVGVHLDVAQVPVPDLIERQDRLLKERAEFTELLAKNTRETVALEQEIFVARMPRVELATGGCIFRLYGATHELDESQCRMLLDEVTKLNRYMSRL